MFAFLAALSPSPSFSLSFPSSSSSSSSFSAASSSASLNSRSICAECRRSLVYVSERRYLCDRCMRPFNGPSYSCTEHDFDLCISCYQPPAPLLTSPNSRVISSSVTGPSDGLGGATAASATPSASSSSSSSSASSSSSVALSSSSSSSSSSLSSSSSSSSSLASSSDDEIECRICLESTSEPVIRACACRRVHRSCLLHWRLMKAGNYHRCEVCHTEYRFQVRPWWARALQKFVTKKEYTVAASTMIFFSIFYGLKRVIKRYVYSDVEEPLVPSSSRLSSHFISRVLNRVSPSAFFSLYTLTLLLSFFHRFLPSRTLFFLLYFVSALKNQSFSSVDFLLACVVLAHVMLLAVVAAVDSMQWTMERAAMGVLERGKEEIVEYAEEKKNGKEKEKEKGGESEAEKRKRTRREEEENKEKKESEEKGREQDRERRNDTDNDEEKIGEGRSAAGAGAGSGSFRGRGSGARSRRDDAGNMDGVEELSVDAEIELENELDNML